MAEVHPSKQFKCCAEAANIYTADVRLGAHAVVKEWDDGDTRS